MSVSARTARVAHSVAKKYTLQSTGIWERIRRLLAVDPNRSNGIPLNPQFRNPPPGANPPTSYDDPISLPAGDIADNAYFARDVRRAYPRASVVGQADVVALLSFGSQEAADPKLAKGKEGEKQLVEIKEEGEGGLARYLETANAIKSVLGPDGLPPAPTGLGRATKGGEKRFTLDHDREEGFPPE